MLLAGSHLIIATDDVPRITAFFGRAFGMAPAFENDMFSEFVLPSKFRIAFFKPVGASAASFTAAGDRSGTALGVTVADVDVTYARIADLLAESGARVGESPEDAPVGREKLLADRYGWQPVGDYAGAVP